MRQGDGSDNSSVTAKHSNQPSIVEATAPNTIILKCEGQEFHFTLTSSQQQTGTFEIQTGVQCRYLLRDDRIILETECDNAISIGGSAPILRYIYIHTGGTLNFEVKDTNPNLHFRLDAAKVKIDTKISTNAVGAIFTYDEDDNNVVFAKDCFINILLLKATTLILEGATINTTRAYVSLKRAVSTGTSGIIVGVKQFSAVVDEFNIIPPNISQIFTNNSFVEIDEFVGGCNLDFCDTMFTVGALSTQGDLSFCRSVVLHEREVVRAANTKFILQDSTFNGTTGLDMSGCLDVLESDMFIDGMIFSKDGSILNHYASIICGNNVQIKGKVKLLDKNPNRPFSKFNPDSRIVSSNEIYKEISELIDRVANIVSHEKITEVTDQTIGIISKKLTEQEKNENAKRISKEIVARIAQELIKEGNKKLKKETIAEIGSKIEDEIFNGIIAPEHACKFVTIKYHTTKHTSCKQLRDFIKSKTSAANETHLRVMSVPGDGDCALYTFMISLMYAGICYEERQKIIDILRVIYDKHNQEVVSLELYGNLEREQFDMFAQEYMQANYNGYICGFFNKYFDMHARTYNLTRFLAACSRFAIRDHAIPRLQQIHNYDDACKRFTEAEKKLPHYPDLLAAAKLEVEVSLQEALLEFLPQHSMNMQHAQRYLASQGISSNIKNKSGNTLFTCVKDKYKIDVTFLVSGDNDLNRHYEPELDLQKTHGIKFGPSITQIRDENADILLDMMAIMCYYVPKSINVFGAEYAAKIEAKISEIFEARQQMDAVGNLVIYEGAKVSGPNGHLYATGALLIDDELAIDNCVAMSNAVEISKKGILDGVKNLRLQSNSMVKNHGKILGNETQIISDYFISTNAAYVAGKDKLDIQALVKVLNFSYLYTTSGNISSVAFINTGVMHVWNCPIDSVINLDGVTIPCLPQRASDLCDRQKLFTLFKMGLGVISAEAALALQVVTRSISLANTTRQMHALYGQLKNKNWSEFSRHDTAALLMQMKRAVNEGYGAYRIAPSVGQMSQARTNAFTTLANSSTGQNTYKLMESFKTKGLQAWEDPTTRDTFSNYGIGAKEDLMASYTALRGAASTQYSNAGLALQASKTTVQQAWLDKNDLQSKLAAQGKWLPNKTDIPADSALKTVVDATVDVAAIVLPYKHVDAVIDIRYGFQGTFSHTSQSFWGFDGPLYSLSAIEFNQRLFSQKNSIYSRHKSYDYNTVCGLDYTNYGTVDAVNWSLSARDYNEHGVTDAPCKIFDIRRDAYFAHSARFTGLGEVSGMVGRNFRVDGTAQLGYGRIKVGEEVIFANTAEIITPDLALFARQLSHQGNWNYGDTLYVEVEHVSSSPESMMSGTDSSTAIIKAKTETLQGKGQHAQIFYDIEQMAALRARDLAYQLGGFSEVKASKSVKVTTQSIDNVMYAGLRSDAAMGELVTLGGVTLDPNVYTRARGDVFSNYNEAASVAANYASYKIPPPPPPSRKTRFWRKIFKEVVKVLEGIGAVISAASTPEAMLAGSAIAGAAAGVDQLVKHVERKENKKIEAANRTIIEGQHRVNRAILSSQQQSANLALIEGNAYQNAQALASGTRRSVADKAAANQKFVEQQSQMNADFASQFRAMDQMHEHNLYDLRVQNDAARKQISRSGGAKIGFGGAVNTGSTGTSINFTTTIGSQNPITSRTEILNFESGRLKNRPQRNDPIEAPKVPPPIMDKMPEQDRSGTDSKTRVFMLDELGNEVELVPMEDTRTMRFSVSSGKRGLMHGNILEDTSYLDSPGYRESTLLADESTNSRSDSKQEKLKKAGIKGDSLETMYVHTDSSERTVIKNQTRKNAVINKKPDLEIDLHRNIAERLLIGAGRMFVETGQGVIQLAMQGGELIGVVDQSMLNAYTDKIRVEHTLYGSTPVANSKAAKIGEFGAGLLLFSIVPGGVAAKGYKLALSGAASGAAIMGLQPVYEGTLTQRGVNVLVGAASGSVLTPAMAKTFEVSGGAIVKLFARKVSVQRGWQVNSAPTSANLAKLTNELEQRTLKSVFNKDGTLTQTAINEAKILQIVLEYNEKTPVRIELSKRNNIGDWVKARTQKFHTGSESLNIGDSKLSLTGEVHFYKNIKTGEVYYGRDYKIKIDAPLNPQIPVKDFILKLPKNWRPGS